MIVFIQLDRADVGTLLSHIEPDSDLHKRVAISSVNVLPDVTPRRYSNQFHCSEGEAYELLRIARNHCSSAVPKIQDGMRLSGVRF